MVCTPRPIRATGNGLSSNLKTFGDMPLHSQISILCDLVSWKKVKAQDYFITKPSLQDGHGGVDTQCKEHTFSRNDHRSRIHCRIPGGTKIGQVIDITVVQNHWSSWNRNCSSFETRSVQNILGTDHKRDKIDLLMNWKIPVSVLMSPVPICSNNKPNLKKQMLPKGTTRAPGNRAGTKTSQVPADRAESCSTQRESNVLHEENH